MPESQIRRVELNVPQARFLALPNKFKAYVAGFGSGKTWVGCTDLGLHFWSHPKINQGYFAPSYPLIRDIFYPTMEEVCHGLGLDVKIHQANKEVHVYEGRKYRGVVFCRSMDAPEHIVGFKIGNALIDELDLLKTDKAATAWRKIIARMRYNDPTIKNGISVTTTPEGFRFVYQQFKKLPEERAEVKELYGLVQASTYDNEANLPTDYISSLRDSYPQQLIDAYLGGKFVNLTSGSVYPDFDRTLNGSAETIRPHEPLSLGMDFNVYNGTAVVLVMRDGELHAVDELVSVRDTPSMVKTLQERFTGHSLTVFPDASGQSHKSTNASASDLTILRQAGIAVQARSTNPPVRDRVAAVNAMILNGSGERRFKINTRACPKLTEALEQQAYDDNGEPDKSSGQDHLNDALGYPIAYLFPVVKKSIIAEKSIGH